MHKNFITRRYAAEFAAGGFPLILIVLISLCFVAKVHEDACIIYANDINLRAAKVSGSGSDLDLDTFSKSIGKSI